MVGRVATHREVRMTDAEITAACAQLGLPRPVTLPGLAAADDPAGQGPTRPVERWEADLLTTLAQPSAVVFAHCMETGSPVTIRVYAVRHPWAAEQVPEAGGIYALTLLDAGEFIERLSQFCQLHDQAKPESRPCEVSGGAFLKAMGTRSDPSRVAGVLRSDGLTANQARGLASAISACERMAQVTVLHRPDPEVLKGTSTAWLDSGPAGLWEVLAPKLAITGDYGDDGEALVDAALVVIRPTTKPELIAEIERGFPG
jgi:hypothetical protein